jgi:sugar phosphate isomerase/epimerase
MIRSAVTVSLVPEARGGPFVLWDDLPAACKTASELGFDAIELFAPSPDAVKPAQLRMLLEDYNLRLAAVGTGAGWVKHKLLLTAADSSDRSAALDFVRRMIDLGGPFGAPAIIGSMQGRWNEQVDRPTALRYLGDALQTLGQHAAQYTNEAGKVPLIYEPLNRYETNLCCNLAAGAELIQTSGAANVKLLADLFHLNIEEVDIAAALVAAGTHVGHVHFVDSNRRAADEGHLDYAPIVAALGEINFAGYASAEVLPWPDPRGAAERAITAYRRWFKNAPRG